MMAVLDTSAAVAVLLKRPMGDDIAKAIGDAEWVLVPAVYTSELCNVFWKYHHCPG